ncbi:MAG TPA: DMT family transporter [Solirubrobacteraceae bacterium]|nr:DMT family transporter [Solirubrobacteraceae bacterium]
MSRLLAVVLVAVAGVLVGAQPAVNARLGRAVGAVPAAAVSFTVGTIALLLIVSLSSEGFDGLANIGKAPWWAFVGGLLGAAYVTVAILTVGTLGVSALTAVVISGQLFAAVLIDRFGLLGIARQPIGATRILGLVLLVAGVVLVVRR